MNGELAAIKRIHDAAIALGAQCFGGCPLGPEYLPGDQAVAVDAELGAKTFAFLTSLN